MNLLFSSVVSLSNIISFLIGIVTGAMLLFAVILLYLTSDKRKSKKKKISGDTKEKLTEDQIKEIIENKQISFVNEVEENDRPYVKTAFSMTMELLHEISSYYFPDSKYPEYELTISEAIDLVQHILDIIEKQVEENKALKPIKGIKISTIAGYIDKGREVKASKAMKIASEGNKTMGVAKTIVNVLNPIKWFRKIVVDGTINIAAKKLCKAELSVAGREFDKVYSKSLFEDKNKDKESENASVEKKEKEDIEEIFSDEGE